MSIEAASVFIAVLIGVGATLFLDLWSLFLRRAFKAPFPNYCLLGRWLLHMPDGTFAHASIASASSKRFECTAGWIAHYAIGAAFALLFVAFAPVGWLAQPTLFPALCFGLVTVLIPYLVMQPAYGLGIAASKTPDPAVARLKSLVSHGVFGLGLYISAVAGAAAAEPPSPPPLFIVHFETGPAWDKSLAPADQPSFTGHSANLNRLRKEGVIHFGARYGDFGMIILEAVSLEAADAVIAADPGVQSGLFIYRIAPLNVFYPWQE